jgi:hypothetical protein
MPFGSENEEDIDPQNHGKIKPSADFSLTSRILVHMTATSTAITPANTNTNDVSSITGTLRVTVAGTVIP